jgi:hypothetical protein
VSKGKAYLELMRVPNLFTAAADVLAGYLIIRGSDIRFPALLFLVLSSTAIYAAGCALNDFCDRDIDAGERPSRPIPSKRVSPSEALGLTLVFFGIGLAAAFMAGVIALVIASILCIVVISYDAITKHFGVAGPFNMAACRSLNLALGMSEGVFQWGTPLVFPFLSFVYIFSVTRLSASEVKGRPDKGWYVLGGWSLVMLSALFLQLGQYLKPDAMIYCLILIFLTGPLLIRALLRPSPQAIQRAVKGLIVAIPILDAVYVSGIQEWAYAIPVGICILPPPFLAKHFYVT